MPTAAWPQLAFLVALAILLIAALVLLFVVRDRQRTELRRHRRTDTVAGVLNERAFLGEIRRELARARRHDFPVALLMISLEGVRAANVARGKAAGNALLKEVADAWDSTLRQGDVLSRRNGVMFAILLPHVGKAGGRTTLDRLVADAPPAAEAVGAVVVHEGDETPEAMLARAEAAMRRTRRLSGESSPARPQHPSPRIVPS